MKNKLNSEDVKALRKQLGFTQERFAKVMDVDTLTVSRWERGKTKPMPVHDRKMMRLLKRRHLKEGK